MPELPEVETIRGGLEKRIVGQTVKSVEIRVPQLFHGESKNIIGAKVAGVRRRGKVLLMDLDNGQTLMCHLKMTGQLVYQSHDEKVKVVGGHPQAAYNEPLPHKHTHVIIIFTSGDKLYFNDLRKFGWMEVRATSEVENHGLVSKLGPDPLHDEFTWQVLKERIGKYKNRMIFPAIMDQKLVAGIGNIYANESLYVAKISPERKVGALSDDDWQKLHDAIQAVLRESLKYGGTSDSTYVGVDGQRGDYLAHARVYHQKVSRPEGLTVVRKKINGRTAHYVPERQK